MNNKQIEGMAKVICPPYGDKECYKTCVYSDCVAEIQAEDLYNAGYGKRSEWISVKDRLPESFVGVLVLRNEKTEIDYHEEDGWFAYDFNEKRVTHWMPLPAPPTEKEN